MATPAPVISQGLPVEIGRIDRELKKLWEQAGGVVTRASLMNLAVYCEGEEAMSRNTGLIAELTRAHACRALLIVVDRASRAGEAEAWISAHCHISRAGAKQVCCEQITFRLPENSEVLIPNIVFSHLDSDLPLYLWWQEDFDDPLDEQLFKWVDRLIFDSRAWKEPAAQLRLLRSLTNKTTHRLTLRDLNWTRSLFLRQAAAQIFDTHPETISDLLGAESVVVACAPGFRSTGLLFAGWLMGQMKWRLERTETPDIWLAKTPDEHLVRFEIRQREGPPISEWLMKSPGATFHAVQREGSDFFRVSVKPAEGQEFESLLPPGPGDLLALFNEELTRGTGDEIFLRAFEAIEALL